MRTEECSCSHGLFKSGETARPDASASLKDVPLRAAAAGGAHLPLPLFFRVTLPAAWRGVLASLVLAFARAIGEFGATIMVAGNIPGRTNTMPLEIFVAYQGGDDRRAAVYVAVLTLISVLVVALAARLSPREGRA